MKTDRQTHVPRPPSLSSHFLWPALLSLSLSLPCLAPPSLPSLLLLVSSALAQLRHTPCRWPVLSAWPGDKGRGKSL